MLSAQQGRVELSRLAERLRSTRGRRGRPRRSSGRVGVRCNIYSDWASAAERPADTDDGVSRHL